MTNRDFEFIAGVFAQEEIELENLRVNYGETPELRAREAELNRIVGTFKLRLSENHPRFNWAVFEKAALPLATARHKAAILRKLNV